MFDDKDLEIGDVVQLVNADDGTVFGIAKITDISKKQLGNITADDFIGHENYKSIDKMYNVYRDFYGDRVDKNTEVKNHSLQARFKQTKFSRGFFFDQFSFVMT
ncbi:hypothetical protein COU12_00090 [Candidatus Jorgensenbacteria bacterium CG10_big_fil_rev_8_21_14_0_10_54_38]|uniref:ASCH domain-containing protein n=2 Tax=Candidatus Joergenseniibacteriota TaxID=1752739 RepID=A0A2M6WGR7_9BACT|nr:MAG: hypothetical protein COX26_02295 [Candidatus Jorgensenbacteria bacterium CG23_combo_of_CG06-09_8_20_14_all_54_14]PIT91992.1 MAG: hypothetical protein COU12_00090 [Candidatus Jorgensenbacteria bacterium CG10_big_fil_rev_8_21_14_0_10_54_38]